MINQEKLNNLISKVSVSVGSALELYNELLFEHIQHGDEEHRKWLKDEMSKFLSKVLDGEDEKDLVEPPPTS